MALTSENGKTRGTIDTDVKLSGKAAAMGGGVIKEVSGKLVDQFAKNLADDARRGHRRHPADARGGGRRRPGDADRAAPTSTERRARDARAADARGRRGRRPGDAERAQPPAEADALDVGNLVGPMIVARLRDPKVLGGLGLLIAVLLLLRRRR